MPIKTTEKDFLETVSAEIRLSSDGTNRFRVFTPFRFDDGDHFAIVLKKEGERWLISDEGHTYMHLTYDIDDKLLHTGTRKKIISRALSLFDVEDRDGELIREVSNGDYGKALYAFAQALLRIADVSYLSRERIQSTFTEDFRTLLSENVPKSRMRFDWSDPERDPEKNYIVDCRINGMREPLFVFALNSDNRTRDATIALHQFKEWGISFRSLGIFKNREIISRKVQERFSDVCDTTFYSLILNYASIQEYLIDTIGNIEELGIRRK
ncbi:DUF1828 domain-containing protein [Candidatus Poribacteria bacterium]|nr:DUF1828 domain-containing protein [Candidatus Poribacteria bacterium]